MTKQFNLENYLKDPTLKVYYRCGKRAKITLTLDSDYPVESRNRQYIGDNPDLKPGWHYFTRRYNSKGKVNSNGKDDYYDLYLVPKGEKFHIPYENRYVFLYKNSSEEVVLSKLYTEIEDLEKDMERLNGFCFKRFSWEVE